MPIIAIKTTKFALLLVLFVAVLVFSAKIMGPVSAADDMGLGTLDKPPGVEQWTDSSGLGVDESPILFFASKIIDIIAIIAGIWAFLNIVVAGYTYITSQGNAAANEKVRNLLTQSAIGILIIVLAYTAGGLLGLIFFGDASFILEPTI